MENAAKALSIAGGILIALIILAGLIYTFQRMSEIPDRQNYIKEVEEMEEFNRQFEAYQKKLMYGVDVISCLNKVIDNNKKSEEYAYGRYNVKISIELKSPIEDDIRIYYFDGKEERQHTSGYESNVTYQKAFGKDSSQMSGSVKVETIESYITKGKSFPIKLTNSDKTKETLEALSSLTAGNLKKQYSNPDVSKIENIKKIDDKNNWIRIEWYTSAYNFKNKKFKCTGITYNDEGRIDSISFEEYILNRSN